MDISERYYRVYQFCLAQVQSPDQSLNILSKSTFWQLKRERVSEQTIAAQSGLNADQIEAFVNLRQVMAHRLDYLHHDTVFEGAIAALEQAKNWGWEIILMTMRRTSELNIALQNYPQLAKLFPEKDRYCLRDDEQRIKDIDEKPLLMKRVIAELPPVEKVWMVGDKEADIVSAQAHQIPVIVVLSGIRDRPQLSAYQPDYIVNNLTEAVQLIQQFS